MLKIKRKIFKSNRYSYAINLPRELVKALGWKEKQYLEITPDLKRERLIIKDFKSKSSKTESSMR